MNALPVLVRRELWEHRSLWLAPLAVAAVVVVLAIAGQSSLRISSDTLLRQLDPHERFALFAAAHLALPLFFALVTNIVLFFYLLECLYTERRDRSILFWKSLPVSDAATVVSKLLVALLVVPLGVYVLSVVTDLLVTGIFTLRLWFADVDEPSILWDTQTWLRLQLALLIVLFLGALWYAPVVGYLLVVSAWARRSVFLWAVLPPIILILAERITYGTEYVGSFVAHRLVGFWRELNIEAGMAGLSASASLPATGAHIDPLPLLAILGSPHLWVGVAVAALLVWAAIRIRRYRDDT